MTNMEDVAFTLNNINFTWEAVGIIIAALFSVIACLGNIIQYMRSKRLTKIEYITNKRTEWIYYVRQEISEYTAVVFKICAASSKTFDLDEVQELQKKYYTIKLCLNYSGIIDGCIIRTMDSIYNHVRKEKYDTAVKLCNLLISHASIYFKLEWDRIKKEAAGIEYEKKQYIIDAVKAYGKFEKKDEVQTIEISAVKGILENELKNI